jgi:DNA-binding transcriptional regulator YdaS (Cro superfamily)
MTSDDVRRMLARACRDAGSQAAWAKLHNVHQPLVNMTLQGKRARADTILRALGLERVVDVDYRPRVEAAE